MSEPPPETPASDRLVGWKAIAGHLKVSQRTAIRWADLYGLPVSRIPRGDRPLVHATRADLEKWWESSAAREARGLDEPSRRDEAAVPDIHAADRVTSEPEVPGRQDPGARGGWRKPSALRSLALLACLVGAAVTYRWYEFSHARPTQGTAAVKVPDLAHSEATSPRLVELRIALAERTGFVVTVAEGEMARLDTPTVRLGLQTKIVGEQLKIFVYRLKVLGTGESAEYLESRVLPAGNAALRVRVAGVVLEITWSGEIPAGVAAARLPRNQCCLVCAGLTMCAQSVSGTCGGCQGDAKRDRHPEQ